MKCAEEKEWELTSILLEFCSSFCGISLLNPVTWYRTLFEILNN